jgi:hypothetical protein
VGEGKFHVDLNDFDKWDFVDVGRPSFDVSDRRSSVSADAFDGASGSRGGPPIPLDSLDALFGSRD